MAKKKKEQKSYGIIGLGRFGMALAHELSRSGCEILALDREEEKIRIARSFTEHAFVVDSLSREVLVEAGVQNCDIVVIGIGSKVDTSILTTLTVLSLGVSKVISKAISREQGEVLEKLGAEVIYPERDMALRLAKKLTSNSLLEYISLSNEIEISEIIVSGPLLGKSLVEANLREKYAINVIALEHDNTTETSLSPDYVFRAGDVVVVIGKRQDINRFQAALLR